MDSTTIIRAINTRRFRVELTWDYEWAAPDLSWDKTGQIQRQLESGELASYSFSVTVYLDDNEIAWRSLGDSIYADPSDFARQHLNGPGAYFPDMVREAIRDTRAAVRAMVPVRLRETSQ